MHISTFVVPTKACCRAQTISSTPSPGGYPANLAPHRADHKCLPSDISVASPVQQRSSPPSDCSAAPIWISQPQMSLSYRGSLGGPSAGQVQSSARNQSLVSPPGNVGHHTTKYPEGHIEGQTSAVFTRPQRKSSNRDEFDGPHQLLNLPSPRTIAAKDQPLPLLPMSLSSEEQGDILDRLNEVLSKCAFDFIARYQFPIPVEPDKRLVLKPQDREWTEWVYLLKRLATKRRIPARVLYDNQIKHLVTILENSLEAPYPATLQGRPLKDDRSILQLISAGTQVARVLKDAAAMGHLDRLYAQTASCLQDRRWTGLPI